MAASPMYKKAFNHGRSNSLPSRPHPLISQFDEHMCKLKDSQATSTSSAIAYKLRGLQELHDGVDKLLQLPLNQQVLSQGCQQKCVNELLDASLQLLDVCNTAKDALLHTQECIRELESVIRRRQGGLDGEIMRYMTSRKVVKKSIQKALKSMENKYALSSSNEEPEIVNVLREVEAMTLAVFKSMLCFISEPKSLPSKPTGWSLVSKLMRQKRIICEEEETGVNEFAVVDAALESLIKTSKFDSNVQVENLQNQLKELGSCIQDNEEGIEYLFRRMIKTRVSILNIFNC